MSGYFGRKRSSPGSMTRSAACSAQVIRMDPAGVSRNDVSASISASIPSNAGRRVLQQPLARLGRCHAAGRPAEQPQPEPAFQAPDRMAQ